jgi:serine/threonine protein kinase
MDTARFLRLREIFDRALQLPETERESFVTRECGDDAGLRAEIRELWAAHAAATGEGGPAHESGDEQVMGPYRIQGRLGEGGMGAVYLAIRDDGAFRKQVALKVLRPDQVSQELIRRFHQERQVLANLDHPNIARILDGGQTPAGLPYYVMEYVQGVPLDRFCDERKVDLGGRVRLFQQICHAVHYLHENLVVHRDLKPSNILVTDEGDAKLLDFGIAKLQFAAAGEVTVPYQRLMTPGYASPEQISGAPVTRSSDIYSLGLILYQLLTGSLPFADPEAKLHAEPPLASRSIREDLSRTPETTAQLRRRVVGDLDNIVLKCLRRDPRQRYETAKELAEDLQRFLEGRTVAARPGHFTERAVKFLKRNRVAAGVCTLVVLLTVFGAWQALRAQMETHRAAARESEIAHLLDELSRSNPRSAPASSRVEGVQRLRQALERDYPAALAVNAGSPSGGQELLSRGLHYLEALQPYAAQDAALANELIAAYQRVGALAEAKYHDLALAAFEDADHIRGAGVAVPAYAPPQPATAASPGSRTPTAAVRVAAPPAGLSPAAVAEAAQPAAAPPVDPAALDEARSRLADVSAKAAAADDYYRQLSENAQRLDLGATVHPETTAAYNRMRSALEDARRDLDTGRLDSARKNLDLAEVWANRVLKR